MFLRDYCTFHPLSNRIIKSLQDFDCGHADLNDFFANDCYPYELELIGKTYCFTLDTNPAEVVCAFTIANDSIKLHDITQGIERGSCGVVCFDEMLCLIEEWRGERREV